MVSERIQRRIDSLLDEAEVAIAGEHWETVAARARAVLALDEMNEDGRAYLATAERRLASIAAASTDAVAGAAGHGAYGEDAFVAGRYRVRRLLGEGAKKRVFCAYDETLDRDVALALLKTEGLDAAARERLKREAQTMGRLGTHPHIVNIFDTGEHEGMPYLVSELVDGGDVETLLQDTPAPLSLQRTLEITKGVARGLAFAHSRGVIHRDLKPANVWLTHEGAAKLGDFGLALSLDRSRLTGQGMMVGTVAYMPPEQALGGDATTRSDLYSLGAMLYEMVTGAPPFQGTEATEIISSHINATPSPPSATTEHCPPELEDLVLQLLEKDPVKRPGSAESVLAALDDVDPAGPSVPRSGPGETPADPGTRKGFVGRGKELEQLRVTFDRAFAGHGSIALVIGEPGIGKTRIAQELESYAHLRGAQVLWGPSDEEPGAPPYWPWIQIGRQWGNGQDADSMEATFGTSSGTLARLFPELQELPGVTDVEPVPNSPSVQFQLFEAYTGFLRTTASNQPLLLILDDLHRADVASLSLLAHIGRHIRDMRVLVVGTCRDIEFNRPADLKAVLAELNRHTGIERIMLGGLTREEVAEYVAATTRTTPPGAVVDRVFDATEGNPFFLGEVVNLLTRDGGLDRDTISWIGIPDGVRDVLSLNLDGLSEDAKRLIQVAAVAGREFSYEMLAGLNEADDNILLRLIEEGIEARVIEELPQPGWYRFSHALMQETVLAELSSTRRFHLCGEVGEGLERQSTDKTGEHLAALAVHFSEAGTINQVHARKAVAYCVASADRAEEAAAWGDAAAFCRRAAESANRAGMVDDVPWLRARQGHNEIRDRNSAEGIPRLLDAIAALKQQGDSARAARAALWLSDALFFTERVFRLWRSLAHAVETGDPELGARLWALGGLMGWDDDSQQARLHASRLCAQHEIDDPDLLLMLRFGRASRPDASIVDIQDVAAFARERMSELRTPLARNIGADVRRVDSDDLDMLASEARNRLAQMRQQADYALEPLTITQIATVHLQRGDFAKCEEILSQPMHGHPGVEFAITGLRTIKMILQGEAGAALESWTAIESLWADLEAKLIPRGSPSPRDEMMISAIRAILAGTRARLLYHAGRPGEATAALAQWAEEWDWLRYGPPTSQRLPSLVAVDEVLPELGERGLIERVYDEVTRHAWAGSRVASPPFGIDPVRGHMALRLDRLAEAEKWFLAGGEWAAAQRCPWERGRNLFGLARVAELQSDRLRALALLDEAGDLFRGYGARPYLEAVIAAKVRIQGLGGAGPKTVIMPLSAGSMDRPSENIVDEVVAHEPDVIARSDEPGIPPLSARELDVLRLVIEGKRNREIAAELVISPATVARHINNIFDKTGLSNRTELARYALRHQWLDQ